MRVSSEFKTPGRHKYPNNRLHLKTSVRGNNVTTSQKKESAEKLLNACEVSAISESKKSFMSMQDNASDFSTVKVGREKPGNTSVLDTHPVPLTPIAQADTENSPMKESPSKSRFKDRSANNSSAKRRGLESQPSLEHNRSNMQLNLSKQKIPAKELSARRLGDAPKRLSLSSNQFKKLRQGYRTVHPSTEYSRLRKFDTTLDTLNDRVTETVEAAAEDDPYAESFVNQSLLSGKRQSYYPTFERHMEHGEPVRIEFEPSASYLHEVYKFKVKHASARDKVQSFNEATKFWDMDKYLRNVHGKERPSDNAREGRKLNVAEYWKKMSQRQEKKSPSRSRPKLVPTYVIPSEKKRDEVRFNIRMKMSRASGIEFKSPDRRKPKRYTSPNAV